MILELKFKPFDLDGEIIVCRHETVRVSVLASRVTSWYISALPEVVFPNNSTKFDFADNHPCVIYLASSKSFILYFVAKFLDGEELHIELPLEGVTEVADFHELPG